MSRETWVYPDDGPPYRKGERPERGGTGVVILPDLPDFQSPIDGKVYSGRAGLREHCARHNVVPTSDLKGLPNYPVVGDTRSPEQKRSDAEHRKRVMIQEVDKQYRKYNG